MKFAMQQLQMIDLRASDLGQLSRRFELALVASGNEGTRRPTRPFLPFLPKGPSQHLVFCLDTGEDHDERDIRQVS